MKKDTHSTLDLSSDTLDLANNNGLYVQTSRSELGARLYALCVDLEAVLEKKKDRFQTEIRAFVSEIEKKKKRISFNASHISTSVSRDEKVGGLFSLLLGIFGIERRKRKTFSVVSRQLNTGEIDNQIETFISEAEADFEKRVVGILDVEKTVQDFAQLALGTTGHDEFTILKVAIRRSFLKLTIKPWHVRYQPSKKPTLLNDPAEIQAASESAEQVFERIFQAIVSKAHGTRKRFDSDMERTLAGLKEELIHACLDRKLMEQMLQAALQKQKDIPFDSFLRGNLLKEPGVEELRRALLIRPV